MKAIEFFLRKEKEKDFSNNKSSLKIFLLKEINEKYKLYLDSDKLIYIILNLSYTQLTDPKSLKILSDPIIQKDGITLDKANNLGIKYIDNKLAFKIIEI